MSTPIEKCRFCGSTTVELDGDPNSDPDVAIECGDCGAQGPVATIGCRDPDEEHVDLEEEAIALWNRGMPTERADFSAELRTVVARLAATEGPPEVITDGNDDRAVRRAYARVILDQGRLIERLQAALRPVAGQAIEHGAVMLPAVYVRAARAALEEKP